MYRVGYFGGKWLPTTKLGSAAGVTYERLSTPTATSEPVEGHATRTEQSYPRHHASNRNCGGHRSDAKEMNTLLYTDPDTCHSPWISQL